MLDTPPGAHRRRPWLLVLVVALVAALALVGLRLAAGKDAEAPLAGREQLVDPDAPAARAAEELAASGDAEGAALLRQVAAVPTGIWLTPEDHPAGVVGEHVRSLLTLAEEQDRVPVLVVYGVPDRDCTGGHSAGGLTEQAYPGWVQEIADAVSGVDDADPLVVLEPDALVASVDCGLREQRVALVADAARRLDEAGATTYLDAGHSGWRPAPEVADLLRDAGVADVRGFATNVANYRPDQDERRYAAELSRLLGGARYVIDSGRNGGTTAEGEWCNPSGAALGRRPAVVDDDSGQDAWLWIKPPGESDGECQGGPPAGEYWPQRALELARAAGW